MEKEVARDVAFLARNEMDLSRYDMAGRRN